MAWGLAKVLAAADPEDSLTLAEGVAGCNIETPESITADPLAIGRGMEPERTATTEDRKGVATLRGSSQEPGLGHR
jgi:hypothetical protein